jgi:hypothetical protein
MGKFIPLRNPFAEAMNVPGGALIKVTDHFGVAACFVPNVEAVVLEGEKFGDLVELAKKAVEAMDQRKDEDINEWADQLVNDTCKIEETPKPGSVWEDPYHGTKYVLQTEITSYSIYYTAVNLRGVIWNRYDDGDPFAAVEGLRKIKDLIESVDDLR